MVEETKTSVSGEEQVEDATNYIEAIKEMKKNSVSKEAYDKLMDDNKALLDAIINGKEVPAPAEPKQPADIAALRKKLFSTENGDLSNIDYIKTALELRDALIEQQGVDPFLPMGKNISPTAEDMEGSNKLADAFKSCIEYADGDSQLFTQELQRITKNDTFIRRN